MEQIINNLKILRIGIFRDEQAVNDLLDSTLELAEQRLKAGQHETIVMPELTSFEVSKFERERDVMAYLAETIELLGGDDGPELDTLQNWLYRLRKKAMRA